MCNDWTATDKVQNSINTYGLSAFTLSIVVLYDKKQYIYTPIEMNSQNKSVY